MSQPHFVQFFDPRVEFFGSVDGKEEGRLGCLDFEDVTVDGTRNVDDLLDVAAEEAVEGLLRRRRIEPFYKTAARALGSDQADFYPRIEGESVGKSRSLLIMNTLSSIGEKVTVGFWAENL